ncbi:MAG: hypothetical protein QOC81_3325 [Thermoanaerobaculia bacterium]|jgi:hypothetical protein|nr:hypothetical protein [Thermoanaerobaculia bacterium]
MKRVVLSLLLALVAAQLFAANSKPIRVSGPTIIAFFSPVTEKELDQDLDLNDALDDFQVYVRDARGPLEKSGIRLHEIYAHQFRITINGRATTFKPGKVDVGYYFVAPGKKPFVSYGVATDEDLFRMARDYFRVIVVR